MIKRKVLIIPVAEDETLLDTWTVSSEIDPMLFKLCESVGWELVLVFSPSLKSKEEENLIVVDIVKSVEWPVNCKESVVVIAAVFVVFQLLMVEDGENDFVLVDKT